MDYYWFAILDNIKYGLTFITVLFFILGCVIAAFYSNCINNERKSSIIFCYTLVFTMFLVILNVFIPSQKQMAFIIAAPYMFEDKQIDDKAKNLKDILRIGKEYIKAQLDEKDK